MPIYEYYCARCHKVMSFLARSIAVERQPDCPHCGAGRLPRRPSTFAVARGATGDGDGGADAPAELAGFNEDRFAHVMDDLASKAEGLDDNDPRTAARVMREMFEATGLPMGGGMQEALERMASGEDPDQIEAELGDALDEDPFGGATERPRSRGGARRSLPPTIDPKLYEFDA